MGDRTRASCQGCGRHRSQVGNISWTGLCRDCARAAVADNLEALETRQGYNYTRWARGMARFAASLDLDGSRAGEQTSPRHA